MDKDELLERAMPAKMYKGLTTSQVTRMKSMVANGYTISQIAESMGVSSTTIRNYLKKEG